MSMVTNLLKLFKYEPGKDDAQTFNLDAALNENWDKVDQEAEAVRSALSNKATRFPVLWSNTSKSLLDYTTECINSGARVGSFGTAGDTHFIDAPVSHESGWGCLSYTAFASRWVEAVYRYDGIPITWRRCFIVGDGVWSGEWVADATESDLRNKANEEELKNIGFIGTVGGTIPEDDCNQITKCGMFRSGPEVCNSYSKHIELIISAIWDYNTRTQLALLPENSGLAYRSTAVGVPSWLPWVTIATATPPQEFDLPLIGGFSSPHTSRYCKSQDGIVHLNFCVFKADANNIFPIGQFATLPVGYRPKYNLFFSASGDGASIGNGFIHAQVSIYTDGVVSLNGAHTNINWISGAVSFTSS